MGLDTATFNIVDNSADVVCLYAPSRDVDHNAEQYIRFVSGYYGAAGSLAHKCRNMGKPVMLMSRV